jgi:predicted Zn-dependent protease
MQKRYLEKILYLKKTTFIKRNDMKVRAILWVILLLGGGIVFQDCSTVAITGRKQLNLIPESQMLSMSLTQYGDFLKSHKLSTDKEATAMVRRVGERIAAAVEEYYREHGMADKLKDYQWEFNLVESPEVNAWCMPGGKVVVYTGLLPVARDEAGLAVVMGHEISHAIAHHGYERMSQQLMAQMGGMALAEALKTKPQETQQLWMTAYGVGAQYGVLLPYSRKQESEADHLGLIFMAMAGYDPHVALAFWERMSAAAKGEKPPELMSTHPSDETRIANIRRLLPEIMKKYYRPVK